MAKIHPSAVVDPKAHLASNVEVGPFSVIGPEVEIGSGTVVKNHVSVVGRTKIGAGCVVYPFAALGGSPQDLKYKGGNTSVGIGDGTTIREYCTINTGTELGGGRTAVGSRCLLMAYTHVAHDCILGDCVVLANGTQMAGHVLVEDGARVSGLAAIHHFVRIGACSFVAGMARLSIDVPPFTLAAGYPARVRGLNYEGLKRRGLAAETVRALREAFRLCYREQMPRKRAFEQLKEKGLLEIPEVARFVEFLRAVEDGRYGRAREATRVEVPPEERDGALAFRLDEGDDRERTMVDDEAVEEEVVEENGKERSSSAT